MKILLVALALLALAAPGRAQQTDAARAEFKAAAEAANKVAVNGPSEIKLADQAMLKLPVGHIYVPSAEAGRLLTAMGNRVGEGLLGVIFPGTRDADWM